MFLMRTLLLHVHKAFLVDANAYHSPTVVVLVVLCFGVRRYAVGDGQCMLSNRRLSVMHSVNLHRL